MTCAAMIDWLEATKAPAQIALMGVSMGGATVLAEADRDERVVAVIIESTHASLANAAQARLERSGYPLALPASWAILLGSLIRTGEDVSSADPVQAVERLDERPLLIIHAGADDLDRAERRGRAPRRGHRGRLAGRAACLRRGAPTRSPATRARRTMPPGC